MRLDRDLADYFGVVELDAATMRNAVGLARAHGLRAADAIQLACAIAARAHLVQEDVVVLGSDQELNAAALAEGLPVLDPTQP